MQPNHRTTVPSSIVVVDTETTPVPSDHQRHTSTHLLRLGVARAWRQEQGRQTRQSEIVFRDTETFWSWLHDRLDRERPTWLFAHNLGFDLTVLRVWERFESGDLQLQGVSAGKGTRAAGKRRGEQFRGLLVTDDPPTLLYCQDREGRQLKCADTLNWFLCSLAELGTVVGLDKLPMPGELGDDADWETYCRRDVEVTARIVSQLLAFVVENDLGVFKPTVASQAMHLFRHRCLDCAVTIDTDTGPKELDRLCYYGPRTEVLFAGACVLPEVAGLAQIAGVPAGTPLLPDAPVYSLDLTAAYPTVMGRSVFPVRYLRTESDIKPDRLRGYFPALAVLAEVTVEDWDVPWPRATPVGIVWSRGRFLTHLCGPELQRCLEAGKVLAVHRANLYVADRPFETFAKVTWGMRQHYAASGQPLWARLCKLLANSLHGKFGQKTHAWELQPGEIAEPPWGTYYRWSVEHGTFRTYRSIAHAAQLQGDGREAAHGMPAIAAYTVSYHRELMRQAVQAAGLHGATYVSADTLHVTQLGFDRLKALGWIAPGEPGKFRVEAQEDRAIWWGPKHYKLGERYVCAGLSRKAWQDPQGTWHQTNFLRLDSLLNHDRPAGPVAIDRSIEQPMPVIHGTVGPDGWVAPPVHL